MKCFAVIVISLAITKTGGSIEQFDENSWMDNSARDKYFEYSDLSAPFVDLTNYSDNIDLVQFNEAETRAQPVRRHLLDQGSKIIDFFLTPIRNILKSRKRPVDNTVIETDKGLDVQFESSIPFVQPNFGNNQEMQLILIGTKWCGAGDVAKNKRDIGYFYMTDSCCRAHDLCPFSIEPQNTRFGLKNAGKFVRSHCDCDDEFYRCLKSVNSLVSKQVGIVYFNVLGPQCFKEDYPLTCTQFSKNRCVSYSSDTSQDPQIYQWLDNKWF